MLIDKSDTGMTYQSYWSVSTLGIWCDSKIYHWIEPQECQNFYPSSDYFYSINTSIFPFFTEVEDIFLLPNSREVRRKGINSFFIQGRISGIYFLKKFMVP